MAGLPDRHFRCHGDECSVGADVSSVTLLNRSVRRSRRIRRIAVDDVTNCRSSRLMTSARLLLATMLVLSWSTSCNVVAEGYEYKASENNGCTAAKQAIGEHTEMSSKMIPVQHLHVCSTPGGSTCCTPQTEANLIERSKTDFNKIILNRTNEHRQAFASRFTRLNGFIAELLNRSRYSLHDMFIKTYGQLYQQNAQLFTDLFADFQSYIDGHEVDLSDVLDQFFVELMRRMFALVNDMQPADLGDSYVSCMTTRIDRLKPFGDVPVKLVTQLKRAFVAARALLRGLAVGRDVVSTLGKMEPGVSCIHALTRMSYCPYCRGLSDVRPCQTFCLNVARGCLATRADVNDVWNSYIDEMLRLSARLKGPFNIANVVSPIDVKLSDAIMNFQDNSQSVSSKIFQGCGVVSSIARTRRNVARHIAAPVNETTVTAAAGPLSGTRRGSRRPPPSSSSSDAEPPSPRSTSSTTRLRPARPDTDLAHLVDEMTQRLHQAKDLWKLQLTLAVCNPLSDIPISTGFSISPTTNASTVTASEEVCWNGHSISRYSQHLVGEGTKSQTSNPEVEPQATNSPIVSKTVLQLQETIATLRQAFNGKELSRDDTESVDDGSASGDDLEEVSGSGSGCGDLCISRSISTTTTTTGHFITAVVTDSGRPTSRPTPASGSARYRFSISGLLLCLLVTFVLSSSTAKRVPRTVKL